MATSVARMRFSASRCFSMAKSQSNAVSLLKGEPIIDEAGGVWIKKVSDGGDKALMPTTRETEWRR
jgi:hypothetical protein